MSHPHLRDVGETIKFFQRNQDYQSNFDKININMNKVEEYKNGKVSNIHVVSYNISFSNSNKILLVVTVENWRPIIQFVQTFRTLIEESSPYFTFWLHLGKRTQVEINGEFQAL